MGEKLEALFMEEKVHFNPNLTIWDVSKALNTNRTYVSNFINQTYRMNFSRYVNHFRIEEAKRMLRDPDAGKYSLDFISEQCGFGSLSNFVRVFHSFENMAPGRYRENHPFNLTNREKES